MLLRLQELFKKISFAIALIAMTGFAIAEDADLAKSPWMNKSLSASERTELVLKEMTFDEKLSLMMGYFGTDSPWKNAKRPAESYTQSAGFVYGVPRLGIPHLWQTDA